MDLNRIDLKPLMLAELYGNMLVETEGAHGSAWERMGAIEKEAEQKERPEIIAPAASKTVPTQTHTPPAKTSSIKEDTRSHALPFAPMRTLGNNGRNIVVVVDHADAPVLPDAELQFLTTVLAACKLGLADIAIVNRHGAEPEALEQMLQAPTRQVLLFGVEPLAIGLPINFPHFQVQPFSGRTWIYAPPLHMIENDRTLKGGLWNGLKQLFGL